MRKVFILGWDGATFDLIKPWIAQGKLPNIARLMRDGGHGELQSTLPYWTYPAWSSFLTGVNPGKHGIFDFTRRRPGGYDVDFVNAGHRRAPTLWRMLSDAGKRVVSISVPCTYPPEKVNGVMISGFDAPGLGGHDACVDARGMHPPELFEELREGVGKHPIGAFVAKEMKEGRPDLALERVLETVKRKAATAKYLLEHKAWDCFMVLFGESDGVGHYFWRYCDERSPLYSTEDNALRESILRVYQELDRQAGELVSMLPDGATVMMMSDHGFGGVGDRVLYPNCWLLERGLLRFRGRGRQFASRLLERIKLRAVASLPARIKRGLYRVLPQSLGRIESNVRHGMIDWSGTQAYFEENPYFPGLWVNLRGRQPGGIVDAGAEYEEVRDRLIAELRGWVHPESGKAIVRNAYRREEVYSGPCLEGSPDVVVDWALDDGYSYSFRLSCTSPKRAWHRRVEARSGENEAFFSGKSGTHRREGILVATGNGIRGGVEIDGARIIDLAPTILHMLGVAGRKDFDGRVLTEILTDKAARECSTGQAASQDIEPESRGNGYSSDEEDAIRRRLQALGYID